MPDRARAQRLEGLVGNNATLPSGTLVKALRLPEAVFAQLQGAVTTYIWHTLTLAYPKHVFAPHESLLMDHAAAILDLPNRTPNGVLLPRVETFLSFNLIHQALARMFESMNLFPALASLQRACNVRILSGAPDALAEKRPLASSKLHTDIWAGEPMSSILFNILVLGEPEAVDLEFFEPDSFPEQLLKPLADYDLGKEMANRSTKCPIKPELGIVLVSDALSLHQTVKRRPGYRVSVDFRGLPRTLLAGETNDSSASRADYIDVELWRRSGATTILTSAAPLDSFSLLQRGETIPHPEPFSLSSLD
jgi:hypothetical protein